MRRRTKIALVAVSVGLLLGAVTIHNARHIRWITKEDIAEQKLVADALRVATIAHRVHLHGRPLRTAGGQIDVYRLLRADAQTDLQIAELCTSDRSGSGPSASEVHAGDYRRFPYARITTPYDPTDEQPTAVVWDSSPQAGGRRLVGLDTGKIRLVPEAEFAAFLEEHSR